MSSRAIIVMDSVFDPDANSRKVYYYRGDDGKLRYKVWLFLQGIHLFYVDYVIYTLHPTFKNPSRVVKRHYSNENCELSIWTWGVFDVNVKIFLKTGDTKELIHRLTFQDELQISDVNLVDTRFAS